MPKGWTILLLRGGGGGVGNFFLLRTFFLAFGLCKNFFSTLRLCTNFFSHRFSAFIFIKVSPKMSILWGMPIQVWNRKWYMYLKHCFLSRLIQAAFSLFSVSYMLGYKNKSVYYRSGPHTTEAKAFGGYISKCSSVTLKFEVAWRLKMGRKSHDVCTIRCANLLRAFRAVARLQNRTRQVSSAEGARH